MKGKPFLFTTTYVISTAIAVLYGFLAASPRPYFGHSFIAAGWLTSPWTWLTFDLAGAAPPTTLSGLAVVVAIFALLNAYLVFSITQAISVIGRLMSDRLRQRQLLPQRTQAG